MTYRINTVVYGTDLAIDLTILYIEYPKKWNRPVNANKGTVRRVCAFHNTQDRFKGIVSQDG